MARSRVAAVQSIDQESDPVNASKETPQPPSDDPNKQQQTANDGNNPQLRVSNSQKVALRRFAEAAAHNPGFLRRQEKRRTNSLTNNTVEDEIPVPPSYHEVINGTKLNDYNLNERLAPYTKEEFTAGNVDNEDITASSGIGTVTNLLDVTFNEDNEEEQDDSDTIIGSDSDETCRSYSSSPPSSTSPNDASNQVQQRRRRLPPLKVPYSELEESGDMVLQTPAADTYTPVEDTSSDMVFLTTPTNKGPDQVFPLMQANISADGVEGNVYVAAAATATERSPRSHIRDLRLERHEFTYEYCQIEDIKSELEDWYSYSDFQGLVRSKEQFERSFRGDWSTAPDEEITNYMTVQLQNLSVKNTIISENGMSTPLEALDRLYYLVQGVFAQASSIEQQLETARKCCSLLSALQGFSKINGLVQKVASDLEDSENTDRLSVEERRELVEECDRGISILFFMCQLLRSDEEFCQSLQQDSCKGQSPILPFLITSLAKQRNMTVPAVPADRLLGLIRIVILCAIGGDNELDAAKQYCQIRDGFSADPAPAVHCFPSTFEGYVRNIRTKYPFYECPPTGYPSSFDAGSSMTKYLVAPKEHLKEELALMSKAEQESSAYALRTSIGRSAANAIKSGRWGGGNNQGFGSNNLPFLFQGGENGQIPASLEEAGRVYLARMKVTSSMKQLWDERNEFTKFERGWVTTSEVDSNNDSKNVDIDDPSAVRLWLVEQLYKAILPDLQSFTVVVSKLMLTSLTSYPNDGIDVMDDSMEFPYYNDSGFGLFNSEEADSRRLGEIRLKTALGVVFLLLKWFKRSHVLKYEYMSQLLSDANFLSLALRQLGMQDKDKLAQFQSDVSELNYFAECRRLSNDKEWRGCDDEASSRNRYHEGSQEDNSNGKLLITQFSRRSLYSDITMTRLVQKICKRKVYRILFLTQTKSTAILKKLLNIEQPNLKYHVLKLVREQVRYLGKKWRQSNMRLLSMIYLHCNLTLGEDWLSSGSDTEAEIEVSYAQEVAMRAMTQYYNTRHYPTQMEMLGFSRLGSTTDFFSREMDAIALGD